MKLSYPNTQMTHENPDNLLKVKSEVTVKLKGENSKRLWKNITTWLDESGEDQLKRQLIAIAQSIQREASELIGLVDDKFTED